jgi:hypothetical protein
VRDINPGTGSALPENLERIGNRLFFSAFDPTHGEELWAARP